MLEKSAEDSFSVPSGAQSENRLVAAVECLLFVADEPLSLHRLAEILEVPESQVKKALAALENASQERGIRLARVARGYQLLTRPEFSDFIHKLRQPKPDRLGRGSLETLTIVAYKQPVTRPEIEQIRGVDSSYAVDVLLSRRLIREVGRKNAPGRPFLYATTDHFLRVFGLADLSELPPVPAQLQPDIGLAGQTDGEEGLGVP